MKEAALAGSQRLDQWLYFARITKSRTLAQALIERGKVRLNREKIGKASAVVKPGDVLTVSLGPHVRNFEVVAIGSRRGPAAEAQNLFRDITPQRTPQMSASPAVESADTLPTGVRPERSGRPDKSERRLLIRIKKGSLL